MTPAPLEKRGTLTLLRRLASDEEPVLLEAYEFGRAALGEGLGLLEMEQLLWRIVAALPPALADESEAIESFLIESLSAFEMAHRGAREANESLRRLDERREEHVRMIARELHDHAGQAVARVRLSLDALAPHVGPKGRAQLDAARDLLEGAGEDLRRLAHELRPAVLDDLGLLPALRSLAESVTLRSGVAVTVSGNTAGRLPETVETAVFRTAQEGLHNVLRHAHASHAVIEVDRDEAELRWLIRDDGCGLDAAADGGGQASGMGLVGMRERVARLGGTVDVRSRPGEGVTLAFRVPLEVAHAH